MNKNPVRDITQVALIAALYVVLTVAIAPLSYGPIQMRLSECMVLLCFYKKKYGIGLIIGCAIANLFSPYPLDIIFGTLSTVVAVVGICYLSKNLEIATIWPTLSCLIVAGEISVIEHLPYFITAFQVLLGEAIVINLIAYPLFKAIENNRAFDSILKGEREIKEHRVLPIDNIALSLSVLYIMFFFTLPVFEIGTIFDAYKLTSYWWLFFLVGLPILFFLSMSFFKGKTSKIISLIVLGFTLSTLIIGLILPNIKNDILMSLCYGALVVISLVYTIFKKEN